MLPTYQEGEAAEPDSANYPYPRRTKLTGERRDQRWRTLNLENEYLSCRVLPDLGGHLYGCRDKRNGREVFYANPVIKKTLFGRRGAWAAFGIESNFPVAHARGSLCPVDYSVSSEADGSARAIVENVDRVTGLNWRVEFVLRPGSAALEQRVLLWNHGQVRKPYSWWSNASVEIEQPGMQFIVPTRLVMTHGAQQIFPWPVSASGRDESLVAGHKQDLALFAEGCREPFAAVYKPRSRSGVAHFADPAQVSGKKIWVWGLNVEANTRRQVTDGNSFYVEFQAGTFTNQEMFSFLQPGEARGFSEWWIPVFDLGGVTRVTPDAIVHLERGEGVLKVELGVTHRIQGARVQVTNPERPEMEWKADLDPGTTFARVIANPAASAYAVRVTRGDGALALEHVEGRYDADAAMASRKLETRPDPELEALTRGRAHELREQRASAFPDYRAALERFPSSAAAAKAAGISALLVNRFAEAAKLLERSAAADPADSEAAYYVGAAHSLTGGDRDALQALERVAPGEGFALATALERARIEARAGNDAAALKALAGVLAGRNGGALAGAMEVALLRRAGRLKEAAKELARWRAADPASSWLRFEGVLAGGGDEALLAHLGADSERVLDLADEYLGLGMYDSAVKALDAEYPVPAPELVEPGAIPPGESALIAYYSAYCRKKLGQNAAADLAAAAGLSPRYTHPYRASSIAVLRSAVEAAPSDPLARFLLARLLLHSGQGEEAAAELWMARKLNPRLAGLDREMQSGFREMVSAIWPEAPANTPAELAVYALRQAALGDPDGAAKLFRPRVFSSGRQPELVRTAWIEVQALKLLDQAQAGNCVSTLDGLDRLGDEDQALPFTFRGFDRMKLPHFQYRLGTIEALCRQGRDAQKRWSRIAPPREVVLSPESAFALLAAAKVNPAGAAARMTAALEAARGAAGAEARLVEGILLHGMGRDEAALHPLLEAVKTSPNLELRFLALLAVQDLTAEAPPRKPE